MARYKGRPNSKAIERDFPHIVEIAVPLGATASCLSTKLWADVVKPCLPA
jgi:hypothetical protein